MGIYVRPPKLPQTSQAKYRTIDLREIHNREDRSNYRTEEKKCAGDKYKLRKIFVQC